MGNPYISFFAPPSHARATLASSFPRSCPDVYLLCVCGPLLCVCRHCLCVVCCVCASCGCAYGCAGLYVCVLEPRISAFFCFCFCLVCRLLLQLLLLYVSCRLYHAVPHALYSLRSSLLCDGHRRCISLCVQCAFYASYGNEHIISRKLMGTNA